MNWLEQLERELDQRLSAFLRNNPIQDQLFQRPAPTGPVPQALKRQRQQLQKEAEEQRVQLLDLAADVRGWNDRTNGRDRAGAMDLAGKSRQLDGLMEQGRQPLGGSGALGRRFEEVDRQLSEVNQQQKAPDPPLEQDWAMFEAEQELEELRRRQAEQLNQRWSDLQIHAFGAGGSRLTPSGGGVGSGSAISMCCSTISGRSLSRQRMR